MAAAAGGPSDDWLTPFSVLLLPFSLQVESDDKAKEVDVVPAYAVYKRGALAQMREEEEEVAKQKHEKVCHTAATTDSLSRLQMHMLTFLLLLVFVAARTGGCEGAGHESGQ